jgi:hypothetical protein
MTKTLTDYLAHTKHGVPRAIFRNAVTALRKRVDELHMRLRRRLAAMKREPGFQEFLRYFLAPISEVAHDAARPR